MDATSKEYTPDELEFLEAMKMLIEHPRFEMLVEAIKSERENYALNLARDLSLTGGAHAPEVNQRYVDHQRGFWNGALWAVTQFPKRRAKNWDKFVAEQTKEADSA